MAGITVETEVSEVKISLETGRIAKAGRRICYRAYG